jgi:hypothetical protein
VVAVSLFLYRNWGGENTDLSVYLGKAIQK